MIKNNNIIEIGKKSTDINKFKGQYIGLIKIKKNSLKEFYRLLLNFSRRKNFKSSYMTDLLTYLINNKIKLSPVYINQEWLELDTDYDFKLYKNKKKYNKLHLI